MSDGNKTITDADGFQLNVDSGRATLLASGKIGLADDASNSFTVSGQAFFGTLGNGELISIGAKGPSSIIQDSLATVHFGSLGLRGHEALVFEDSATHLDGVNVAQLGLATVTNITQSGNDTGAGTQAIIVSDVLALKLPDAANVYLARVSSDPNAPSGINDGRLLYNSMAGEMTITSTSNGMGSLHVRNTSTTAQLPKFEGISDFENLELWFTNRSVELPAGQLNIANDLIVVGNRATFIAADRISLADDSPSRFVVGANASFSVRGEGDIIVGIRDLELAGAFVPVGEAVFGSITISAPNSRVAIYEDGQVASDEGGDSRLTGDMLLTGENTAASLELQAPGRVLDDLQARSLVDGGADAAANANTTLRVTGAADFTATEINLGLRGADLIGPNAGRIEFGSLTFRALSSVSIFEDATMLLAGDSDKPSVILQSLGSMVELGTNTTVGSLVLIDPDTQATITAASAEFQIVATGDDVPIDIDLLGRNNIGSATIVVAPSDGRGAALRDLRFRNTAAGGDTIGLPSDDFEDLIVWSENADIDLAATGITTRGDMLFIAGLRSVDGSNIQIKATGQNPGNEVGVFLTAVRNQQLFTNFARAANLPDGQGSITDQAGVSLAAAERGIFFAAGDIQLHDNPRDLRLKNLAATSDTSAALITSLPAQPEFDNLALWLPNASIQLKRSDFTNDTLTVHNQVVILSGVDGTFESEFDELFLTNLRVSSEGRAITDADDFALLVNGVLADGIRGLGTAIFVASGDITLADSADNQLTVADNAPFRAGQNISLGVVPTDDRLDSNRGADSGGSIGFGALKYFVTTASGPNVGHVTVLEDDVTRLFGSNVAQTLLLSARGTITNAEATHLEFNQLDTTFDGVFASLQAKDADILLGDSASTIRFQEVTGVNDFLSLRANNAALEIDTDVNLRHANEEIPFVIQDTLFINAIGKNVVQVGTDQPGHWAV